MLYLSFGMRDAHQLPDPTAAAVAFWFKRLSRERLHDKGWVTANQRFHGITRAVRPFIREAFSKEEQEAAFDGFTLALMTMAHFGDIDQLARLFEATKEASTPANPPTTKPQPKKLPEA